MQRLQNRSLLGVNEDFGDKRNDKRAFLVNLLFNTWWFTAFGYIIENHIKQAGDPMGHPLYFQFVVSLIMPPQQLPEPQPNVR